MQSPVVPNLPQGLDPIAHLLLLTMKQVRAITGYSANHIYRRMRAGTFPQSVHIGQNSVRWKLQSIEAWLAEQQQKTRDRKNRDDKDRSH